MRNKNVAKAVSTDVKRMRVQKLTPSEMVKITGGCADTRDCKGPGQPTCIAYLVLNQEP